MDDPQTKREIWFFGDRHYLGASARRDRRLCDHEPLKRDVSRGAWPAAWGCVRESAKAVYDERGRGSLEEVHSRPRRPCTRSDRSARRSHRSHADVMAAARLDGTGVHPEERGVSLWATDNRTLPRHSPCAGRIDTSPGRPATRRVPDAGHAPGDRARFKILRVFSCGNRFSQGPAGISIAPALDTAAAVIIPLPFGKAEPAVPVSSALPNEAAPACWRRW
jgi:hypothetical protein